MGGAVLLLLLRNGASFPPVIVLVPDADDDIWRKRPAEADGELRLRPAWTDEYRLRPAQRLST